MNNLTKMTRIEIVVSAREAPAIRDLITSAGATALPSCAQTSVAQTARVDNHTAVPVNIFLAKLIFLFVYTIRPFLSN